MSKFQVKEVGIPPTQHILSAGLEPFTVILSAKKIQEL